MNKLTLTLDASAFGESACMLRLFNTVVLGYAPKKYNNDMEFGSAVHQFRKVWRTDGPESFPKALAAAGNYYRQKPSLNKKDYLTENFLTSVCFAYSEKYKHDSFEPLHSPSGETLVEQRFIFPYYADDLVEILFAGTMDELGKYHKGAYANGDLKVTALWNKWKFFDAYKLSGQLRFYRWVIREYARTHPDSIFAQVQSSENIESFIDGVFHKSGAKDKPPTVEFERSLPIRFTDLELDEIEEVLQEKVYRFVEYVHAWILYGKKPNRDGILTKACQTVYGECKYACACSLPDPISREMEYENQFIIREYDPMTHGEMEP